MICLIKILSLLHNLLRGKNIVDYASECLHSIEINRIEDVCGQEDINSFGN